MLFEQLQNQNLSHFYSYFCTKFNSLRYQWWFQHDGGRVRRFSVENMVINTQETTRDEVFIGSGLPWYRIRWHPGEDHGWEVRIVCGKAGIVLGFGVKWGHRYSKEIPYLYAIFSQHGCSGPLHLGASPQSSDYPRMQVQVDQNASG